MIRSKLLVAIALPTLVLSSLAFAANDAEIKAFDAAKVSLADAVMAAEKQGGVATEAEFDVHKGVGSYDVTLIANNKLRRVSVDSQTAQIGPAKDNVIERALDRDDLSEGQAVQTAKVHLADAVAAAEKQGGKAIDAGAERENGKTVYKIEIVEAGETKTVWVDITTGQLTTKP
jgi:uncharacterized membrane protein YkoI